MPLVTRRDILTLHNAITGSPQNLEYRGFLDALRAIKILESSLPLYKNDKYFGVAKLHGYDGINSTSKPLCPHHINTFLPWHRIYILKLEKVLQNVSPGLAFPYWDWTTTNWSTICSTPTYQDLNNIQQTHPLFSTAISTASSVSLCQAKRPNPANSSPYQQIRRKPQISSSSYPTMSQLANEVNYAMNATVFAKSNGFSSSLASFTLRITSPHDKIHNYVVGGDMASSDYASYDPLFWLHHANVDRIWASWQNKGNPLMLPSSNISGFNNQQLLFKDNNNVYVASSLSTNYLGYTYDSFINPLASRTSLKIPNRVIFWLRDTNIGNIVSVDVFFNTNQDIKNLSVNSENYAGTLCVFGAMGMQHQVVSPDRYPVDRFIEVTDAFRRFSSGKNMPQVTLRGLLENGSYVSLNESNYSSMGFEFPS